MDLKVFYPEFFGPSFFWTQNFFNSKIFWIQIFLDLEFLWTQNFVDISQIFYRPEIFVDLKVFFFHDFFVPYFFGPKISLTQKFFGSKNFLTEIFLD